MRLHTAKEIKAVLKECEPYGPKNLYYNAGEIGWVRIWRARIQRNKSTGEQYTIVETMGGHKETIRPETGGEFNIL